jgi:hypothetical protein
MQTATSHYARIALLLFVGDPILTGTDWDLHMPVTVPTSR